MASPPLLPAPTLEQHADPAAFLDAAAAHLAADPVVTNMVATHARRAVTHGVPRRSPHFWFAVVRDAGGRVVGTAMRTATFEPWPLWVDPMTEVAAVAVAEGLFARGEHPGGANGALPAARVVAERSAELWGGEVVEAMATTLHELGELCPPDGVPGRARQATYDDLELCRAWLSDFDRAAREQAGDADRAQAAPEVTAQDVRDLVDRGRLVLWEDAAGRVVHLTGFTPPVFGVARVGPVYTPAEHRGHGYAAATVAEVSRRLQGAGVRVSLFTDRENPVSNRLYHRLGYRPVVRMAHHTVTGPTVQPVERWAESWAENGPRMGPRTRSDRAAEGAGT